MGEVMPEGQQPLMQQAQEGQPPAEQQAPEVEYAQIPAEEWQQMQSMIEKLGPLAEYAMQLEQQPQQQDQFQQPQQSPLDPFSDDFETRLGEFVDQRMQPVSEFTQEQQMAEANEQARDIVSDYLKEQGKEFLGDQQQQDYAAEVALTRANHYVFEEAAKYGEGLEAAEAAIKRATDEVIAYQEAIAGAGHEQQMGHLRQVTNAPQQPPQGTQAAQTLTSPTGGPQAVFAKYFGGS